ncbi:hypothetical protein [Mageeibacillus indolicus]|nr:hypothetical protein [Mageeibacillus indolicus]
MSQWGVGPIFVGVLIFTTALGILLSYTNLFPFVAAIQALITGLIGR